jgi:hypothetical protein
MTQRVVSLFAWHDRTRTDGVTIKQMANGNFRCTNGEQVVLLCPCCDMPMRTLEAAKAVADEVWPLEPQAR